MYVYVNMHVVTSVSMYMYRRMNAVLEAKTSELVKEAEELLVSV